MRALVLADTSAHFRSVGASLTRLGFEVVCPNSIRRAYEILHTTSFDLVVACVDAPCAETFALLSAAAQRAPLLTLMSGVLRHGFAGKTGAIAPDSHGAAALADVIARVLKPQQQADESQITSS